MSVCLYICPPVCVFAFFEFGPSTGQSCELKVPNDIFEYFNFQVPKARMSSNLLSLFLMAMEGQKAIQFLEWTFPTGYKYKNPQVFTC